MKTPQPTTVQNEPRLSAEIIKLGIINEDGSITFAYNELVTAIAQERNKVIEEVKVIVKENIFPDENILAETDESKIVRTYANFKFEEVIKELNQLKEGGNDAK